MKEQGSEVALALSQEAVALNRQASDIAGLCKEIVLKTAVSIAGRKYVRVEGWTSIATTHGCITTIKSVERVDPSNGMAGGMRAIAELRRIKDGSLLSTAEGFVGEDEPTWYGGPGTRWNKFKKCEEEHIYEKRADFAIRAMAQTRATSRVCRGPFSHIVVLIDANLSTTPAEEVVGDEDHTDVGEIATEQAKREATQAEKRETAAAATGTKTEKKVEVPRDVDPGLREQFRENKWEAVVLHFTKHKGKTLGELTENTLRWFINDWQPKPFGNRPPSQDDLLLRAALDVASEEAFKE